MIDGDALVAAAATEVHLTRCQTCQTPTSEPGECWGYDEVDVGIVTAVLDTALKRVYHEARQLLWAAHRTVTP